MSDSNTATTQAATSLPQGAATSLSQGAATSRQYELTAITKLVEPVVTAAGFRLYDLRHQGATLAILVTAGEQTGVTAAGEQTSADTPDAAALTQLSRSISRQLDEHDPLPHQYTLEVSSPGLERRLLRPDHYIGAIGETVSIRLNEPRSLPASSLADQPTCQAPQRRFEGLLSAADQIGINIDGIRVPYTDIDKARTVFKWGPPEKNSPNSKQNPPNSKQNSPNPKKGITR